MQDFIDQAKKNGITLSHSGKCQLCGADTTRGIYECVSLYSIGFELLDFSKTENYISRFLCVDSHALQHPEIHGRWNNHFHLTRLHLILKLDYKWDYNKSPLLSKYLNVYKNDKNNEFLIPPKSTERGSITTIDILNNAKTESECKDLIYKWALIVYNSWTNYHNLVDIIAKGFIDKQ